MKAAYGMQSGCAVCGTLSQLLMINDYEMMILVIRLNISMI